MNIQEIQKDLIELKKGIDSAKTNLAKLDGRETELLSQLKKNHGLSSAEEISNQTLQFQKDIDKEVSLIETDYKKIKEEFSW